MSEVNAPIDDTHRLALLGRAAVREDFKPLYLAARRWEPAPMPEDWDPYES